MVAIGSKACANTFAVQQDRTVVIAQPFGRRVEDYRPIWQGRRVLSHKSRSELRAAVPSGLKLKRPEVSCPQFVGRVLP